MYRYTLQKNILTITQFYNDLIAQVCVFLLYLKFMKVAETFHMGNFYKCFNGLKIILIKIFEWNSFNWCYRYTIPFNESFAYFSLNIYLVHITVHKKYTLSTNTNVFNVLIDEESDSI